jgi:hypothetical protein
MNVYKDFYFIYVLTGTNYILPVIQSFQFIPDDANVVILTNTPGILKGINPKFNLIVADLEQYRDEWSKNNEQVLAIEDEQTYIDELKKLWDKGYRYPMGIMRFGMKWAVDNNVSKFILVDSGCKIGYDVSSGSLKVLTTEALNYFNRIGAVKNVIFGHPQVDDFNDHIKLSIQVHGVFKEAIEKNIPEFNLDTYPLTYHLNSNDKQIGYCRFDGYCIGFWFHDISLIEKAFNFWNDSVKWAYDNKYIRGQQETVVVEFEYALSYIAAFFSKYYNTIIAGHESIIKHQYHPDNDFYNQQKLDIFKYGFKSAKTRSEFINLNRDLLSKFMDPKLIYNF